MRPWWDPWILIWYPLFALLRMSEILYPTSVKIFLLNELPTLLPVTVGIDLLAKIFQWLVWIGSLFSLTFILSTNLVFYPIHWWINLLRHSTPNLRRTNQYSTRKIRRKRFHFCPRLRAFNRRLMLLSAIMICPSQAYAHAEQWEVSVIKFVQEASPSL